tara:strand:+ start:7049 stop:7261 length:213 start_codon:yes stop_codon:yes gene_type:complete
MSKRYKVFIVEPEGIRVKGDDYSNILSKLLSDKLNDFNKGGWTLSSIVPSMISDGCVIKLIVTIEKENDD